MLHNHLTGLFCIILCCTHSPYFKFITYFLAKGPLLPMSQVIIYLLHQANFLLSAVCTQCGPSSIQTLTKSAIQLSYSVGVRSQILTTTTMIMQKWMMSPTNQGLLQDRVTSAKLLFSVPSTDICRKTSSDGQITEPCGFMRAVCSICFTICNIDVLIHIL